MNRSCQRHPHGVETPARRIISAAPQPWAVARLAQLFDLDIKQAIVVGHSWGTLVALSLALDHPAHVQSLVLLSGYYFRNFCADVLMSLPSAAPIIGDLLSYTVSPLLGRAMRSRVLRKFFAGYRTAAFSSRIPNRAVTATVSA
jgi:pimeloyl-ACP methyl ester carboxylesterase